MMTKVVHAEDIGTGLEISGGKLNAAATMATDAEVAAAITAQDAAENAAEAVAALRANFLRRAQQVLTSEAIWEVTPTAIKFSNDLSNNHPRILVMGAGEGPNSLSQGHLVINPPAAGTVVTGLGTADTVVDPNGYIPLAGYGVLYYRLPAANSAPSAVGEWFHTNYAAGDYDVPEDCVFIAQSMFNGVGGRKVQLFDGRILTQGLNYQDTNWLDLTPYLASGVVNYGSWFRTLRFRRKNNRVYLEGLALTPTPNYVGTIANLPNGFTPQTQHIFSGRVDNGAARVDVAISGAVSTITNPSAVQWLSLDGINFGLD